MDVGPLEDGAMRVGKMHTGLSMIVGKLLHPRVLHIAHLCRNEAAARYACAQVMEQLLREDKVPFVKYDWEGTIEILMYHGSVCRFLWTEEE